MPITHDFPNFRLTEFRHPELINADALAFLQRVRTLYGKPLVVTNDARTPAENAGIDGSVPTSLHLDGTAFDLKLIPDVRDLWKFVAACVHAASQDPDLSIELGIYTGSNAHIHLGVAWDGRASKLYTRHD